MNAIIIVRTLLLTLLITLTSTGVSVAKTPDDQLIVGMNMNNLLSLDPAAMTGNDAVAIIVNLYDSLVELDPHTPSKVLPGAATAWKISDDGKLITFTLRDGMKFHSGNPVTAADFAWSMNRLMHLNLAQATTWKSSKAKS